MLGASAQITVLERRGGLGGVLRTIDLAGVPYDVGAEAFLVRRPELTALLAELGLAAVHPTSAAATVRAGGRTVPLPAATLVGVPTTRPGSRACSHRRGSPPWPTSPAGRCAGSRAATSCSVACCARGSATS